MAESSSTSWYIPFWPQEDGSDLAPSKSFKRKAKSLTSSLNNKKRVPLKLFVINQEYFFLAESA